METVTDRRRKKKMKRKQVLILGIMLSVMFFFLISYAWFYFKADKEIDSELADVMAPYYLYLIDEEGDSLSLTIGSLHPGEIKEVVIGVSNRPAEAENSKDDYLVGKNSEFEYQLALAYTQNLPITYKVYELKETEVSDMEFSVADPESGNIVYLKKYDVDKDADESQKLTEENNKEMYGDTADSVVNYVQYDLYPYDSDGASLRLKTKVENLTTSYELDYYLIEMEWAEELVFQDFIKETDLVYVIVDAVQPEPQVESNGD